MYLYWRRGASAGGYSLEQPATHTPVGRAGSSDELAAACEFLCTPGERRPKLGPLPLPRTTFLRLQ